MYGWVAPLQEILVLKRVKFRPWGRVSAPAGVAPEALEECLYSSKGYKHRPLGCCTGMAVQHIFQPASALFQPPSAFSVLVQRLGIQLNHQAGAC